MDNKQNQTHYTDAEILAWLKSLTDEQFKLVEVIWGL